MDLLKENIPVLVRKLAIPASVGTLFQTLYNIVDTFYSGLISPEALSALSKSFPIYFIIVATSIGVTVGGTSLIGNSIGEKNEKNASYYFTHIIIYGLLISVFITFIGLYFSEKVFNLMGSTQEITNLGLQYTNIMFYGSFLFFLVVSLNSLLHAEGDTKTYRNVLILSFLLNIILNPILIFGFLFIPAMGMMGIGLSTIIAQLIAFLIILFKVLQNPRVKKITIEYFNVKFIFLKNIFFQSMPISIAICGYAVAATFIFTYVGQTSELAVAGYGAATRIEQVVLLPILGINTAIISIIAQNFGANNFDRVKETYFVSIKYGLILMVFSGILVYLTADIVPRFFSSNEVVLEYGRRYLKIAAFILPAYPIFFLSNGFFMGLKKSNYAMVNNMMRNVLVPICVFYLAKYLSADFDTFFWLWFVFQWTLSILLFTYVSYYIKKKLDKSSTVLNPQP
ncbi:MATE family efflux transporter [Candidatus Pelagibacter sp.]|jgi:putative MATE family efflux protein|nr:MATE family efflux transporter [Candidatus Pelagibacter sp.]